MQISDMLNISVRTYQRIEKGERKPSCNVVIKLQSLFNQPIGDLLQQVPNENIITKI